MKKIAWLGLFALSTLATSANALDIYSCKQLRFTDPDPKTMSYAQMAATNYNNKLLAKWAQQCSCNPAIQYELQELSASSMSYAQMDAVKAKNENILSTCNLRK